MKELLVEIAEELEKRKITTQKISEILQSNKDITNRRVIGGYSSVAVIDREGQKIPISALKDAANKFMLNIFARPVMVFHCLTPETKILTFQHGYQKYEEIQNLSIGMKVFAHTGKTQKILKVINHEVDMDIYEIKLYNGETIRVTGEHPILTRDRGFVKSSELTANDILLHVDTALSKGGQNASNRRWDKDKGKHYEEIFGESRAEEIKKLIHLNRIGKGTGDRAIYTVTEKHNSNDRRGRTWIEIYGHCKPNYGGQVGEKNTNWQGGISALPYAFDFTAKRDKIRLRDDFRCQLCGKREHLEINEYSRRLTIHHIDYDKQNSNDSNLIALCNACNLKVNYNRKMWTEYFNKMQLGRLELVNGISIKTIKTVHYIGKVYNLEIENDKTYSGRGIIFHNSDVQCGRVIPKWTNPETGETIETKVDDIGWFTVCEIRDDIEIANKTWEEILKGNIRSFSIAGSSKDKLQKQEHGVGFEQVNELEIYETTLCETPVNQQAKFEVLWNPSKVLW
jgi:Intein splicing domain/Caudovirus prohead serine protease/HNH endonuclease